MADAKLVNVGALKGPHGLKGQVKAKITLDDPDLLMDAGPLLLADGTELTVTGWVQVGQGLLALTIDGVQSVSVAVKLRGPVFLRRENFPALDDEVYLDEMVGRDVRGPDGTVIGRVRGIADLPAGPALEIERPEAKPILVPALPDFMELGDTLVLTDLGFALLSI